MRGQFSFAAVAALSTAVSGAIIPVAKTHGGAGGGVEAPRYSIPPWFLSLAAEYVIWTCMKWCEMILTMDY